MSKRGGGRMKHTIRLLFFTMLLLGIFIAGRAYEEALEARYLACVAYYLQTEIVYPDCVVNYRR